MRQSRLEATFAIGRMQAQANPASTVANHVGTKRIDGRQLYSVMALSVHPASMDTA